MDWRELRITEIAERMPVGLAVTSPDGRVAYANAYLHGLLGEPGDGLVGRDLATLRQDDPGHAPEDGTEWRAESRLRTRAHGTIHVLEAVHAVRDAGGALAWRIHVLQDLGALAFHDALTGLPNRNLFKDRLARAMLAARRRRGGFALFYIDIDRFKAVNDRWGHEAGDRLLREIAARLSGILRRSDTLARLGGDEFAVILEGVRTRADAIGAAEKLFAQCSEPYELNGASVRVTLSAGIGLYPPNGNDAAALLEDADRAMYRAKAQGRNCYRLVALPRDRSVGAG